MVSKIDNSAKNYSESYTPATDAEIDEWKTNVDKIIEEVEKGGENDLWSDSNKSALKSELLYYKNVMRETALWCRKNGCSLQYLANQTTDILADVVALYNTAKDRDANWCEKAANYKSIVNQPLPQGQCHALLSAPSRTEAPSLRSRASYAAARLTKNAEETRDPDLRIQAAASSIIAPQPTFLENQGQVCQLISDTGIDYSCFPKKSTAMSFDPQGRSPAFEEMYRTMEGLNIVAKPIKKVEEIVGGVARVVCDTKVTRPVCKRIGSAVKSVGGAIAAVVPDFLVQGAKAGADHFEENGIPREMLRETVHSLFSLAGAVTLAGPVRNIVKKGMPVAREESVLTVPPVPRSLEPMKKQIAEFNQWSTTHYSELSKADKLCFEQRCFGFTLSGAASLGGDSGKIAKTASKAPLSAPSAARVNPSLEHPLELMKKDAITLKRDATAHYNRSMQNERLWLEQRGPSQPRHIDFPSDFNELTRNGTLYSFEGTKLGNGAGKVNAYLFGKDLGNEILFAVKTDSKLPGVHQKLLDAVAADGRKAWPYKLIESTRLTLDQRYKFLADQMIEFSEKAGYNAVNMAWDPLGIPFATTALSGRTYEHIGNFGKKMIAIKIKLKE